MVKNRNSMFIVFTGVIIALGRLILGNIDIPLQEDYYILIIMAIVNYVALGFVVLFLYNDFCKNCKSKINSSGMDTTLKKKCNLVIFIVSVIILFVYLILGILYLIYFKTSDLNDAISIIALALSIATNGLIDDYKNSFFKLILVIAKKLKKKNKQR